MPRIRTIKPEFFADEKLSKLRRDVRLLYVGLWVFSDDYGTVRSNPVWIKSNVFPYDEELRTNDVKTWLDALVKARMLEPFEYNGEGFYNIRTFHSHQRVEKPSKPIVPLQEKNRLIDQSENSRGIVTDYSVPEVGSSNRKLEIGSSNGNGSESEPVGSSEAEASLPDLPDVYKKMEKNKKSICDFIKQQKPKFIEPYVELWNLFAHEKKLPKISKVNNTRKKKFNTRVTEASFDFLEILKKAGQSEFLLTGKWFGFDWILENETNYLKVIEGNYGKKEIQKGPAGEAISKLNGHAGPKSFSQELEYLAGRYSEGGLDQRLITKDLYDKMVARSILPMNALQKFSGDTIEAKMKQAVINYFETQKNKQTEYAS